MVISEFFEIIMVLCFGFSWPASVMKSYKAHTAEGKSLFFILMIMTGYIGGIIAKMSSGSYKWYVMFFYILNLIMVSMELILYIRNSREDKNNTVRA